MKYKYAKQKKTGVFKMAGKNFDDKVRCSFCNKTQDQVRKKQSVLIQHFLRM